MSGLVWQVLGGLGLGAAAFLVSLIVAVRRDASSPDIEPLPQDDPVELEEAARERLYGRGTRVRHSPAPEPPYVRDH